MYGIGIECKLRKDKELMERCRKLKEYAQFVAVIRRSLAEGINHQEAVEQAVEECIRKDILADVLRRNRSEIVDSILTEWDENEYREFLKKESLEDGIKIGEERGEEREIVGGTIRTCREFQLSREETLSKIIKDFSLEEKWKQRSIWRNIGSK